MKMYLWLKIYMILHEIAMFFSSPSPAIITSRKSFN